MRSPQHDTRPAVRSFLAFHTAAGLLWRLAHHAEPRADAERAGPEEGLEHMLQRPGLDSLPSPSTRFSTAPSRWPRDTRTAPRGARTEALSVDELDDSLVGDGDEDR